ncbi:MAG: hypothetical protein ISS79_10105 [Phycisphaerae bacterium]|nr:hypothetical protein [Phycisphaerae bacterium]
MKRSKQPAKRLLNMSRRKAQPQQVTLYLSQEIPMAEENRTGEICYLCGKNIKEGSSSSDHVPPKAFYPKDIRGGLNLQTAPSHKKCNEAYRQDEEYFQHCLFPEVLNQQPAITVHLKNDFLRRAQKPQTPAMIRNILKGTSDITAGGVHLPPGKYVITVDEYRIERVALKIVRGLFYLENGSFLPLESAKDIRFCLGENDVPELYRILWPAVELRGPYPKVFSYKYFNTRKHFGRDECPELDGLHMYSLLFWEAVMFCITFEYVP